MSENQHTTQIYTLIKDQEYSEAIKLLNFQLESNPRSRAALSLLGYCNYLIGNYETAAEMYEQLIKYYPEITEYRIYLAKAFYKAINNIINNINNILSFFSYVIHIIFFSKMINRKQYKINAIISFTSSTSDSSY